jgi:hypothetical protein
MPLYQYTVWVRLSHGQSVHTVVWASNDLEAKQLAEAQYGKGNVLGWRRIVEGEA